jgi:hypothetical protein
MNLVEVWVSIAGFVVLAVERRVVVVGATGVVVVAANGGLDEVGVDVGGAFVVEEDVDVGGGGAMLVDVDVDVVVVEVAGGLGTGSDGIETGGLEDMVLVRDK